MNTKRYKFLREGFKSDSGNVTWKIGEWQKAKGELEMCKNGFHCSKEPYDAFSYVQGEILAGVEVRGKHLSDDNKECWEEMRIVKAYKWQKNDSVLFAIFAARLVIKIYEDKYPDDNRPRKAIEAAEAYQKCPCNKHRLAAAEAAGAAAEAARAAGAAAGAAAKIIAKCNKWMEDHIKDLDKIEK